MSEDFQMKFVKPREGDLDPRLVEAHNILTEHGLNPEWLEQDQCLSVDAPNRNHAYVFEPFEGPAFEHLKRLGYRMFGPQCILACINFKVELPQKKHPIYSVCMKGVIVCCTSMDKKTRDHVHSLVELMAGEASGSLTGDVTHLVAGEVGSEKYAVAASRQTPIMSLEWVKNAWEIAQHRYLSCTDAEFIKKYRCPIFKGLVITVSGLSQDERRNVKKFVEEEGGIYTGEMKMNECTHLIINEPKGQKYDYATRWKVHTVNLHWIYDSLDKNYCQREKDYPVKGKPGSSGVKTSTPERSRLSAIKPNIADISAISATHIDETALTRTRLNDSTIDNFGKMDSPSTTTTGDPMLNGCKIYISEGLQGALQEKCQTIITSSGAVRMLEINETVTHAVMEEKVDWEVDRLNGLALRPHVVNSMWLVECVRQGCHVGEAVYLSPHMMESDVELPKLRPSESKRDSEDKRKTISKQSDAVKETSSSSSSSPSSATAPSTAAAPVNTEGDVEVEVEQLLSQYKDDNSKGEETIQHMDEVDGNTSTSKNDTTEKSVDNGDEDATQDPDMVEGGVFGGKTFMFFGFEVEAVGTLSEFVTNAGGECLRGRMKVADYGVVPILGCPVRQTVEQVVTNAWLQMCIEAAELLPVADNPIFQPVDIDESSRPLEGCVLSISGYMGTERDCLVHIAEILGAVCQEFFVRKAKKSLKASTHLIVKEPNGSKYTAAKNWNIPALAKDWLFACARSGEKEDEDRFSIDNISNSTVSASALYQQHLTPSTQGKTSSVHRSEQPEPTVKTPVEVTPQSSKSNLPKSESTNIDLKSAVKKKKTEKQTDRNTVSPLAAESTTAEGGIENVPTSSASDKEYGESRSSDLNNPMASAKAMVEQQEKGHLPQSQKENLTTAANLGRTGKTTTPVVERKKVHSRVEELQQQSRKPILSPGLDSPTVFLAPGYRPKFDLTGVFEYLKSPDVPPKKRESLPLEEVFQHHLAEGVKNSSVRQNAELAPGSSQSSQSLPDNRGPLEGVVISVSKKLGVNQTEYNTIVVELGGDYTWQYSQSCTHFIFQGRANDLNKEYRQAKSQGKFVVSPYWLYACMEQRCRVDESMYPHSYNPSMNLGGVVKTETPGRGLRRSARSTPRTSNNSAATHTPARTTANIRTSAKAAAEVWQESMDEMKKWQAETTSEGTPRQSAKTRLDSVFEEPSASEKTADTKSEALTENKGQGSSSSASSVEEKSSVDGSKVVGSTSGEELKSHLQEKESVSKEAGETESGGSLEIREALSKTLETVKASSSRSKKSSKKRNRRADGNSSGGQVNTSGNLSELATSHHASPWQTEHKAQGVYLFPEAAHNAESLGTEASQSVQITWDDPTGRREKERLAHKLEMVCGPSQNTQNTEDFMVNMEIPDLDDTPCQQPTTEDNSSKKAARQVSSPPSEAPQLAFPAPKSMSKISSAQPIELSEERSDTNAELSPKPIILTTGMAPQERIEFAEVIERLGGTVLEKQHFDPTCTHVIVVKPSRNEKFLAAVATGRWVLHKSYLLACRQEGCFVREDDHEWGNPAMSHLMQTLDSQTYTLVQSAHKWRQKVQAMRKSDSSCKGAYQGWQVILMTEPRRESSFRHLLAAGGAIVLDVKPPFKEVNATHCFVEMHKVRLSESDLEALVKGVTHILKPEFIAAHLTDDSPDPRNFVPPEVEKIQARLSGEQSRKRKGGDISNTESNKRSRR